MRTPKKRRRRLNLRARFLLIFLALSVTVTLAIAVAAGYRFVLDLKTQLEHNGQVLAEILAREALLKAAIEGETNLAFLVESFVSDEIIFAQIVHNGEVLAEKNTLPITLNVMTIPPGRHTRQGELPDGTRYLEITHSFLGRFPSGDMLVDQPTVNSYVRLGLSYGTFERQLRQTIWGVALAALAAILVGAVLVLFYYQRTWKPLYVLNDAMHRFGSGQTDVRARVESRDELETLARSFNEMANAIVRKDQQMYQVNLEMQRANRAKSDFLAAMSHDLKTPLHVIYGYTQLMLEGDGGPPSEVQQGHLNAMLRSSERQLEFIERILNYSKIESGEEPFHPEAVGVRALTEDVVLALDPLAQQKELSLTLSIETQAEVQADPAKLKQVLSNLVENAIKYTEAGEVAVRAYEQDDEVVWQVRDTGPGIPKRYEGFIFEPFGRLEADQVKMTEGMGLGLAIVRRYVEMHGGRVTVESTLGEGSTFVVFIPLEVTPDEHLDR